MLCKLPYYSMAVWADGTCGICCFYNGKTSDDVSGQKLNSVFNGLRYESERIRMELDILPTACVSCMGKDCYDSTVKHYGDRLMKGIDDEELINNKKIRYLHYSLSRQCNLACRMCTPSNSTTFNKLYRPNKKIDKTYPMNPKDFLDELKEMVGDLKHFTFHGGEPLMADYFDDVLDVLLTNKDIRIQLITNGTADLEKRGVLSKISKFKKAEVMMSIDGAPDINEDIRVFANTSTIIKNIIDASKYKNIRTILHSTVSNMNVLFMSEYYDFLYENNLHNMVSNIDTYMLVQPTHYEPSNLNETLRLMAIKKMTDCKKRYAHLEGEELLKSITELENKITVVMNNSTFSHEAEQVFKKDLKEKDALSKRNLYDKIYG